MIVLIVGSSSSLNQSSTIFGVCFNVALAAGCDRTSRACPKTDEWHKSTVKKIVQAMTFRLHSRLLTDESIIFNLHQDTGLLLARTPLTPYGLVGIFSSGVFILPCIPCMLMSILPGR